MTNFFTRILVDTPRTIDTGDTNTFEDKQSKFYSLQNWVQCLLNAGT